MPGTFGYTESTNIVVVTGGTSGSPSDFASFVTADRAGTDTDLLVAGSPASNLALTYAVRPVEDLAILVKCIVANKTAEADFIFITGKDWRGAAQTESIDVTAGNASYTSTKYWSEITTLDCSDNANGGGAVWDDGDLSVTQDVWGVIWDYGNKQYQVDCRFDIGNGGTSTYFLSINDQVVFTTHSSNKVFYVENLAELKIGQLTSGEPRNGSYWNITAIPTSWYWAHASATIKLYSSIITMTAIITETRVPCVVYADDVIIIGPSSNLKIMQNSSSEFESVRFTYNARFMPMVAPAIFSNCVLDGCGSFTAAVWPGVDITIANLEIINAPGFWFKVWYGIDIVLKNPVTEPVAANISNESATSTLKVQYTCNIHIVDKDGTNLSGVIVLCEISDSSNYDTQEFSVSTAADGTITEQIIDYKKWVGTSETLTNYTPMRLTLSKAGYETLVLENITVDGPIDWYLELQTQNKLFGITNIVKVCGVG